MGITGNIEVIQGSGDSAENRAVEVFDIDPGDVPRFVEVLFQVSDVLPALPREGVVGAWTGQD